VFLSDFLGKSVIRAKYLIVVNQMMKHVYVHATIS